MRRDEFVGRTAAARPNGALHGIDARWLTALVGGVIVALSAAYGPTLGRMVALWSSSETFAHGFIVPIIAAWLAWRQRHLLANAAPLPSYRTLVLVAFAGFAWLLGELAEVNAVRQFAYVTMLALAVPVIAGIDVARRLAFPLAFLFFAVPFGEFMLPQLMEWTATFTVAALRATGIPVYREGLSFVIPTGRWSVVEACSGVRYLIASLMVGTLYAHLTYRTLRRRLVFIGIAIAVPLVANWMRAYLIVMLGHLSGNQLAVGVDHLIYGWLFFGLVMGLMFWFGSLMRDDDASTSTGAGKGAGSGTDFAITVKSRPATTAEFGVASALYLAVAVAPVAASHAIEGQRGAAPDFPGISDVPGWRQAPSPTWRPRYQAPASERQQSFTANGRTVTMYVAYYRDQSNASKLISSDNAIVHGGDKEWSVVGSGRRAHGPPGPNEVQVTDLSNRSGERARVWTWYWVDGRWTASPMMAKLYTALAQLTGGTDDSAVVVLSTPRESDPAAARAADEVLATFVHATADPLARALAATKDRR